MTMKTDTGTTVRIGDLYAGDRFMWQGQLHTYLGAGTARRHDGWNSGETSAPGQRLDAILSFAREESVTYVPVGQGGSQRTSAVALACQRQLDEIRKALESAGLRGESPLAILRQRVLPVFAEAAELRRILVRCVTSLRNGSSVEQDSDIRTFRAIPREILTTLRRRAAAAMPLYRQLRAMLEIDEAKLSEIRSIDPGFTPPSISRYGIHIILRDFEATGLPRLAEGAEETTPGR